MKRKVLSLFMALAICLALAAPAFAAEAVATVEADSTYAAGGAIRVEKGGKYGAYTYSGKLLAEPSYAFMRPYSDGMAAATMEGAWDDPDSDYREWESGVYGYIDTNGKLAIPMKYVLAYDFSEDRAFVREKEDGPLLMINKSGSPVASYNNVVVGEYDDIRFHEGLAVLPMKPGGGDEFDVPDFFVAVDASGKIVYTFTDKYVDYMNGYHDGLIAVAEDCIWGYNRTRIGDTLMGAGYRDTSGKLVIQCDEYDRVHAFYDGMAAVVTYKGGFKAGFINTSGKLVVPMEYTGWWNFSNGIGAVSKADEKGALVDKTGKLLTDFAYTNIWSTAGNGLTVVRDANNSILVLDKTGKTVFTRKDCMYSSRFGNGIVCVSSDDSGYILDEQGRDVTPTDFTNFNEFSFNEEYIWLGRDGIYKVYRIADLLASAPSKPAPAPDPTPAPPATPPSFTDVAPSAYYAAPVAWAVANKITSGTGDNKFSPAQDCTNAQILTFIWRAYGKPEPEIDNPFTNSIPDAYKNAAVWAYEKGMVSGTTFDVDKPCTRAMAMTYLWQAAGSPETELSGKFTDVAANAPCAQAVAWAVANGITKGTTDTTFSPENICQRGQISVFLYNALADKA